MAVFLGLCSIFVINKMAEHNFISENALVAELISSNNDNLIRNEMKRIQSKINKDNLFPFMEKYLALHQMKLQRQNYSFKENGKDFEGCLPILFNLNFIVQLYRF